MKILFRSIFIISKNKIEHINIQNNTRGLQSSNHLRILETYSQTLIHFQMIVLPECSTCMYVHIASVYACSDKGVNVRIEF